MSFLIKIFCQFHPAYRCLKYTNLIIRLLSEEVDSRRGGKTILKTGQAWTLLAQLGQLKTGLGGNR